MRHWEKLVTAPPAARSVRAGKRHLLLPLAAVSVALSMADHALGEGLKAGHRLDGRTSAKEAGWSASLTTSRLRAAPEAPIVGDLVDLRVLAAPSGATFRWDLHGDGRYTRDTGHRPRAAVRVVTPGIQRVGVRITESGQTRVLSVTLTVRGRKASKSRAARPDRRRVGEAGTRAATFPASGTRRPAQRHRTASDPGVTIADFRFTPSTITIHVGDTVTWTNDGPSAHTATARDGSFDTGVLQSGQSASHTFTRAGRFSYLCRIHPFMQGTVVVLPAATSPSTSAGRAPVHGTSRGSARGPGSAAAPTNAQAAGAAAGPATSQTLPNTGMDLPALVAAALGLAAAGLWLRRLTG
jgi:plastocyanin